MAPIRRYLRITKYSVLEVRIYLEVPALADTWLLRQPEPALPRIIEAVRPLVLPKLREENERAKGKSKSKKGVRDVVSQDDFEVSIFLTEHSSRHSLLTKHKQFENKSRIKSNTGKLTGWLATTGTRDEPVDIEQAEIPDVAIRQEEDDDEVVNLDEIPEAPRRARDTRPKKRARQDSEDDLFVQDLSGSEAPDEVDSVSESRSKRQTLGDHEEAGDDKKKLGMKTVYDGFSIYGRILCLVVKRKSVGGTRNSNSASGHAHNSQHMMEAWVSTQAVRELGNDEEDEA